MPAYRHWPPFCKVNDDTTARTQLDPAIGVDGSGNVYAVWQDPREGGKCCNENIYFAKRAPGAAGTWGANVKVNDDKGGGAQFAPRIAVASDGSAVAVWMDDRGNQINVFSARLAPGATSWSANLRVTDNTASRKGSPDVAIAPDGTAYAVWEDDRAGSWDVWYAKLAPGATAWSANAKVSDDPGAATQDTAVVGADGAGNILALWLDDRGAALHARMSRLLAGSTTWEASRVASDTAAVPTSLSLSVRSDGKAFTTWEDAHGTSYDIWGAEYDPATVSWGTSFRIDDDPGATVQRRPAVAANATEMVVAWRDDRLGNPDIRATFHSGLDRFTFTYDGLNRLLSVTGTLSSGSTANESFAYDGATSLTSRTGPSATYTIDGANRVTSDGTRSFVWDGADRLVTRGADSFAYDPLSRLVSSTVSGVTRAYAYNGDGLLRSRTEGGVTTSFVYDPALAPAPLFQAGTERLVYGLGPLYRARADGTFEAYARDALGSVRAEVSGAGKLTNAYDYAAYGALRASVSGSPLLGFAGEPSDPSGLIYLRARWYDSAAGRFLTRDPFSGVAPRPASLNGFSYVEGNPARFVDPFGLDPVSANSRGPDTAISDLTLLAVSRLRNPLPDYYSFTLNIAIPTPWTATLIGWSGDLLVDRYGRVYVSYLGLNVGKAYTLVSASATAGYLFQPVVPSPTQLDSFLKGLAISAGGGYILGGQATVSPTAQQTWLALEGGLFSPQIGASARYSEPWPPSWPPSWWPR